MLPAIILFAATYVLMLTFSKYRPYIALASGLIFIVSGMLPFNQIIGLGLVAFVFDTFGGVMVAKLMNIFSREKINPMIGAAGISAFPMSARVVHKLGLEEDNQNFLLMHSIGVNVSGQIASVIAGGLILALVKAMMGG